MIRYLTILSIWITTCLIAGGNLQAQPEDPVSWTYESREIDAKTYELIFTAEIGPGWHLYSQFIADGGPVATSFVFEAPDGYQPEGKALEKGNLHKEQDDVFDMELAWFSDEATFVQKIQHPGHKVGVKGFVEYMVCNDEKCLPPVQKEFVFVIP